MAALTGCGGGATGAAPSNPGEVTRRDTAIRHESCPTDSGSAEKVNVGGDARPDIVIARSGQLERCRSVDMNFDGQVDSWVYRDASGNVVRRENDYDRDGRIDEIALYKGGMLVEKDRATSLAGKLDTWQFYQGGKLSRTERDSDGDSQIDQWWEYPKPERPDCPLIHSDVDGDGRPDPGATVDVCGTATGYVPPERGGDKAAAGASFEAGSGADVPLELPDKPGAAGAEQPAAPNAAEPKKEGGK